MSSLIIYYNGSISIDTYSETRLRISKRTSFTHHTIGVAYLTMHIARTCLLSPFFAVLSRGRRIPITSSH